MNKKIFAITLLSGFVLLNLFSISYAKPLPGQTYPYKANDCNWDGGGDKIGSLAKDGSGGSYWCVPSGAQKPKDQTGTAGTCGASEVFTLIAVESSSAGKLYWCLPSTESIEQGGIKQITCPTGTEIQKDINGKSIGCFDPSKKEGGCATNDLVRDPKTNAVLGCKITPASINLSKQKISGYTMQVKIPCQPIAGGTCPSNYGANPANYIARVYQFGLMIAGLAAFGMIVFGALEYVLSAGNMASQEDAKDRITQAVFGLVLLLGAYLILYTINPNLVSLTNPNMPVLNLSSITGAEDGRIGGLGGAKEEHPLCQTGTYTGITVTSGINIGGLAPSLPSFICEKCKANAHGAPGECVCDTGYYFSSTVNKCANEEDLSSSLKPTGDEICTARGGDCVIKGSSAALDYCPSQKYETGLCGGATNRQCCLP